MKMPALRLRSPFRDPNEDFANYAVSPTTGRSGFGRETTSLDTTTQQKYPWRYVLLMLTCICLIILFICGSLNEIAPGSFPVVPTWAGHGTGSKSWVSWDARSVMPEFPTVKTQFRDEWVYRDRGVKGRKAWEDLLSKGIGLVKVSSPRKKGLPKSVELVDRNGNRVEDGTEVFAVSVVRELKCLMVIRHVLSGYERYEVPSQHGREEAWACLDRVRQAVLCASDTTLETTGDATGRHDDLNHASVGSVHVCKDWTRVRGWLESNRIDKVDENDHKD